MIRKFGIYAAFVLTTISCEQRAKPETHLQRPSASVIYNLMEERKISSVNFIDGNWAYYVEPVSAERLYIAGIKDVDNFSQVKNDEAKLRNEFTTKSGRKAADLMIVACGETLGDDDCDFYSPLHERPKSGRDITPQDVALYENVLKLAVQKISQ